MGSSRAQSSRSCSAKRDFASPRVLVDEVAQHAVPIGVASMRCQITISGLTALATFHAVVDEGHAAGHAGGEIVADRAEDDRDAAGHVFAAVGAAALDHGRRRPELRTAKRSPAWPAANSLPAVAP